METLEKNEPELIQKMESLFRQKAVKEGDPPLRCAHTISMGLLKGEFTVADDLPDDLKIGLFKQPGTYQALIRTSHSRLEGKSNKVKDGRGFAIKLLGVDGEKCTKDPMFQKTQDLLLLSFPTIAIGTIKEFFIFRYYQLNWHPALFALKTILDGRIGKFVRMLRAVHHDSSPLDIRYWSVTPYRFGERAVKFGLLPTSAYKSIVPEVLTENYLIDNMANHLANHEASFDFVIQFFKDQKTTPIENMGREWKEEDAPFVKIATLRIPKQDFQTPERYALAEDLSYSPVHARVEHKPLGGINRTRIFVYEQLWKFRMAARKRERFEVNLEMLNALA
jgi:hypothetical protein